MMNADRHLRRLRWFALGIVALWLALFVGSTLAKFQEVGARGAFAQLQARAAGRLDVHWNPVSDIPDFIAGKDPDARIPYTPSAAERGNPVALARGFLDENRALFKISSVAADLTLLRVEPDTQLGYAHVRLAQTYHNIPVFGKQLVVHIDPQEQIVAVNGHFAPEINVATRASISQDEAERVALADLLEEQLDADERATVTTEVLRDRTRLMVYVDANGKSTLTWNVTIMTDSPLGQWTYFVNAGRPVVVQRFDSVDHAKQRRTFSADNRASIPGRIVIEEGERSNADAIAQAAHDGAGKVYDYFFNTFRRDGVDGRGSPMVSTVHYGSSSQDAENAAWVGERQQMIYGDGGRIFRPLAYGLDVIGHEFTHGITDNTANLTYMGQSGALNESYSDVFAVMIDRDDWMLGEDIVKSPPFPVAFLRSMEDPTISGRFSRGNPLSSTGQPAHMRDYADLPLSRRTDNGGVHVNSGIPNRAAFLVAQALGREKTEQIYYRTLTQYLSPDADFQDAARATMRAAMDLYGEAEANAVRDAFAQVGVVAGAAPAPRQTPPPKQGPAAPPPPAPSTAPGCTNLIVNGDFENQDAGWSEISTAHSSIIDTELPHTGARSAWLGGTDEEPVQYIYQDVSIPANATQVRLAYWRLIHEEKEGLLSFLASDAQFTTVLAKTNGDIVQTLEEFVSSQGDDSWHQATLDLSRYAGKTIRLGFVAENPKNNISSYFIDDVELIACTTGAPAAPQPSTENRVFIQGYIKNADTGRGIQGAQFFILKPGVSATQAAADDAVTRDEVLTMGVSDASGLFQSEVAIPRGQTYSVIVIAKGYRAIVADNGLPVPANASNPYPANANLRPSR